MKILSITPAFAPEIGGIETVVQELALGLKERGHQVDVAHVNTAHKAFRREQSAGLGVYRVPLWGHRLVGWASGLGDLAAGYDLLHVHDPQLMAITANVRMSCAKVPAVLSTHGGFHHTTQMAAFKATFERLALSRALSHYRAVLASSISDEAYFRQYSDRVVLCSNGVNTNKFSVVPIAQDRPMTRWIYWGRLSKNKRVDCLINLVAQAKSVGHSIDLLICGRDFDGIANQLHAQVAELNLKSQISFQSYLSDDDLLRELENRSVYVTASEHEGFGLSIVEAMAAGMQIICRDMAPLNGFVQGGATGAFMKFDRGDADAQELDRFVRQDFSARARGRTQTRQVANAYSWSTSAKNFEDCFNKALES